MYRITKTFKFEGAHALVSSFSEECQNIHGHSYTVDVCLESDSVNEDGMVLDFKEVKEIMKSVGVEKWDHSLILHYEDYNLFNLKLKGTRLSLWNVIAMPMGLNPTAENMAFVIAKDFQSYLDNRDDFRNIGVYSVTVRETATGAATYYTKQN